MQIKTNIRAGSGGASGAGQNSKSGLNDVAPAPVVYVAPPPPPPVYYPPVGRCVGY